MPIVKCGSLIDSNAYPPCLRGIECILVYSACIEQQGLLEVVDRDERLHGCAAFSACPEAVHINMLGFKLAGMVARARPTRIVAVTVDGSMHCIQLHYMLEELEKIFNGVFRREHYVIERRLLHPIPAETVRLSRFLLRLSKLHTGDTKG